MPDLFPDDVPATPAKMPVNVPARKLKRRPPLERAVFNDFYELSHYQDFKKIFIKHSRSGCASSKIPVQDMRFSPLFINSTMSDEN